jgi:hypothetical protein
VADASTELRTTSDMLLLDLQALSDLEEQKRTTAHGDEALVDLAARIEEIAQRVLAGSRRQRELTEAVSEATASGDLEPSKTIETMRTTSTILSDWRDAERAAIDAPEGSVERSQAEALVDRYREEYRRAFEATRRELR